MSGRKLRSFIAGTHYMAVAFDDSTASSGRVVKSFTSRLPLA